MAKTKSVLPDNGTELCHSKPLKCCDNPDAIVDQKGGTAFLTCTNCRARVETPMIHPVNLRSINKVKRKKQILRAMSQTVETLVQKWNRGILERSA